MHCVRAIDPLRRLIFSGIALAAIGCGGGGGSMTSQVPITVSLVNSMVVVSQNGTPVIVPMIITSSSETALVSVSGLPAGVQVKYAATDTNPSGTLTFTANTAAPLGTYKPTVTVNSAGQTASTGFTLEIVGTKP